MTKRRAPVDDDEEFENDSNPQLSCTTLDHVYPANPGPDTRCFCGKRQWKPFIILDDYLKPGDIIRTYSDGHIYVVEMVNQSRARCRRTTPQMALNRRAGDQINEGPRLLPIPGSEEWEEASSTGSVDDDEKRGKVINISPRSACARVTQAELQQMIQSTRSNTMAVASIPVAGGSKSAKQLNQERLAKLAKKPNGAARPLTGAAAKAKASARPKAEKTVRPCGCGCGEETTSYFAPGHDARFKGWMKKVGDGRMSLDELKKVMGQKTFNKYQPFKKSGDGFVTKMTYQEAAEA